MLSYKEVNSNKMLYERDIEKSFVNETKKIGCLNYKFVSPGNAGVPDRIVIARTGKVYFVELKRPNGKLRKLQEVVRRRFGENKVPVYVIKSHEDIAFFMNYIQNKEKRE